MTEYALNDEFKELTGISVEEAYRAMQQAPIDALVESRTYYEAQFKGEKGLWVPISRPLPEFGHAHAVADFMVSKEPDLLVRIVETEIRQRVVWPEE